MKEARNRRVAVFLATLPPERESSTKAISSSTLNRYNEDLRRLARGEGAVVVDLARDLDVSAVGADGIHLTEAGYERVAALFFQAIIATKEAPPARRGGHHAHPQVACACRRRSRLPAWPSPRRASAPCGRGRVSGAGRRAGPGKGREGRGYNASSCFPRRTRSPRP